MSPVLIATIGGLFASICWGAGDWLTAKSSKKFDKFAINFAVQFSGALVGVLLLILSDFRWPTAGQLLVIIAISIFHMTAFLCMVKALSSGSVGIVVPLANTFPLITLVLSVIFLNAVFSGWQLIGILGIVMGAVLLSYERNKKNIPLKILHQETFLALAGALMWGVAFFLVGTLVDDVGWQVILGLDSVFAGIIAALIFAFTARADLVNSSRRALVNSIALITGVIFNVGAIGFYYGTQHSGSVVLPTVMSSCGPLVASFLAAAIDKERIGLVKRIGAVIVVAGIIALNTL